MATDFIDFMRFY